MNALRGGAIALAVTLAGCSSSVPLNNDKAQVETRTPQPVNGAGGATGSGASQSQVTSVDLGAGKSQAMDPAMRTVYFDFDSYVVKDDYRNVIEANAKRLAANRGQKMMVEGHTDERGGSEYNLALGQKRAEAVVKSLETLGASDAQLEAVSFGKERPAVQGSNEEAWAKNRRAELKDK